MKIVYENNNNNNNNKCNTEIFKHIFSVKHIYLYFNCLTQVFYTLQMLILLINYYVLDTMLSGIWLLYVYRD